MDEIEALRLVTDILGGLDGGARKRILQYAEAKFFPMLRRRTQERSGTKARKNAYAAAAWRKLREIGAPMHYSELAEFIGCGASTIHSVLSKLIRMGCVKKVSPAMFKACPANARLGMMLFDFDGGLATDGVPCEGAPVGSPWGSTRPSHDAGDAP